jgi:hypothetical protein
VQLSAVLFLCAALPALADTRFQALRTIPVESPTKGQCDIRLQVDKEVEVSVRGLLVAAKTLSGRDATDDGSECNAPLPNRDAADFNFQAVEHRGEIRLVAEPSRRNNYAVIVAIENGAGGVGRYHFRFTWTIPNRDSRHHEEAHETPAGSGFSWNNAVNYKGSGHGLSTLNDSRETQLGDVTIDIDRGGKLIAKFRAEGGHPLQFSGQVMAKENGRWKADVVSEDQRLHGSMWITIDDRQKIGAVSLEATDGQDHLRLSWDRK